MSGPYQYGTVVDGRYRIQEPLGAGGMGSVYVAEHIAFQRKVALKVLLGSQAADRTARERFVTEARAVCHLQHPNIVTYHDFGTDPQTGHMYLVMELLRGKSLGHVLGKEKPLPATRVLHIIGQLCDALHEAHQAGVVHRDLKPGNVMLVRSGQDADFVKLIDFGIVRVLDQGGRGVRRPLTEAGMVIGTTAYLAPEYIRSQVVDVRTDIYALGIMCYELIAGCRPFRHESPVAIMKMHLTEPPRPLTELQDGRVVPELLSRAILSALEKDPEKRVRSVPRLKAQLLAAAAPLLDRDAATTTLKAPGITDSGERPTETAPGEAPVVAAEEPEPERTAPSRPEAAAPDLPAWPPVTGPSSAGVAAAAVAGVLLVGAIAAAAWVWRPWDRAPIAIEAPPAALPASPQALPLRSEPAGAGQRPEEAARSEPVRAAEKMPSHGNGSAGPLVLARAAVREEVRRDLGRRAIEPPPAGESRAVSPPRTVRPAMGTVTVVVRPYGKVYYKGRYVAENRVEAYPVPAGAQCFEAVHPTRGSQRGCTNVGPGGHVTLPIRFP